MQPYRGKNEEVMADLGTGSHALLESSQCPAGIVEHFEKFKMVSKMANKNLCMFNTSKLGFMGMPDAFNRSKSHLSGYP